MFFYRIKKKNFKREKKGKNILKKNVVKPYKYYFIDKFRYVLYAENTKEIVDN